MNQLILAILVLVVYLRVVPVVGLVWNTRFVLGSLPADKQSADHCRPIGGHSKLQLPGFYGIWMWMLGRALFKPHPRWNVQQINLANDKGKTASKFKGGGVKAGTGHPPKADTSKTFQSALATTPTIFIRCGRENLSSF